MSEQLIAVAGIVGGLGLAYLVLKIEAGYRRYLKRLKEPGND